MLPVNAIPPGVEAPAVAAALQALAAAGRRGWNWWPFWRRSSEAHKQARVLYVEILTNLLLCRVGQRAHPPELLMTRLEWSRPATPAALIRLLDVREMVLVAAPYTAIDRTERVLSGSWIQSLPVRVGGHDVVAVRSLGDQFAEAELVLRRKLYPAKAQAALAKVLDEKSIETALKPTPSNLSVRVRYRNASGSIPLGLKLTALVMVGGWNVARLLGWGRRRRWPWSWRSSWR